MVGDQNRTLQDHQCDIIVNVRFSEVLVNNYFFDIVIRVQKWLALSLSVPFTYANREIRGLSVEQAMSG